MKFIWALLLVVVPLVSCLSCTPNITQRLRDSAGERFRFVVSIENDSPYYLNQILLSSSNSDMAVYGMKATDNGIKFHYGFNGVPPHKTYYWGYIQNNDEPVQFEVVNAECSENGYNCTHHNGNSTEAPAEPTEAPVEPTEAPAEPTEAPAEPTEAPVEPTEAPAEPTEAPAEPTEAPAEPTEAPSEPTVAPSEPVSSESTEVSSDSIFASSESIEVASSESAEAASESAETSSESIAEASSEASRARPTSRPTSSPTSRPTSSPTSRPTSSPTSRPTSSPTSQPTSTPTSRPTSRPTSTPTSAPTTAPANSTGSSSSGSSSSGSVSGKCSGNPRMLNGKPCASTTRYWDGTLGACGCGTSSGAFSWVGEVYTAAGSPALFGTATNCGSGCGKCYKITTTGYSPTGAVGTAGQSITVMITNLCPAGGDWCAPASSVNGYEYGAHFDLADSPTGALISKLGWDNPEVVYEEVSCDGSLAADSAQCTCTA